MIKPTHPYAILKSEKLLPEYFKTAGYKTHMVGKWHMGYCDERYTPTYRGFDTFTGYLNGAEDFLSTRAPTAGSALLDFRNSTSLVSEVNKLPPPPPALRKVETTLRLFLPTK